MARPESRAPRGSRTAVLSQLLSWELSQGPASVPYKSNCPWNLRPHLLKVPPSRHQHIEGQASRTWTDYAQTTMSVNNYKKWNISSVPAFQDVPLGACATIQLELKTGHASSVGFSWLLLLTQIHLGVSWIWKFSLNCADPKSCPQTVPSVLYLQTEMTADIKWKKILFPLENKSFF
jgi:hypothetical protein